MSPVKLKSRRFSGVLAEILGVFSDEFQCRGCGGGPASEVKKETGRWKDRCKVKDLLADGRCSWAVLDFLAATDVGRRVPVEEEDTVSAVSELEVREWLEEQGAGAMEPGEGGTPLFLPTPDFMASAGTV